MTAETPAGPEVGEAWLIERGQPEGLDRPEWWSVTEHRTQARGWARDAWRAIWYSSKADAEAQIAQFDLPNHPFRARAVEHGFIAVATPAAQSDHPFVVRQFEGTPWVPLHEAARLHDAVQSSGLTIAALRNEISALATVDKATREPAEEAERQRRDEAHSLGYREGYRLGRAAGIAAVVDAQGGQTFTPDQIVALRQPAPDDALRTAGMRALRGYHMAHYRDTLPAGKHDHPVERCEAEPFVSIFRALAPEPPEPSR